MSPILRRLSLLATSALLFSAVHAQDYAPTVSTTVAHYAPWQDSVQAVGSLRAEQGTQLAAEVPGIVDWIGFQSGQTVAPGMVLLRLRENDEPGKLIELQAAAALARVNYDRDQKQFRAQAVSQATLDADASHLQAANAQVVEQQALIDEKIIRAPFGGQLGLRLVDLGQYLPAGTEIVTLQALDPIYVDFYVPQQSLGTLAVGQMAEMTVDSYPGKTFPALVTALNPQVDATSRMVQLRATLANPDHKLLPGMFASVAVKVGAVHRQITLPNAAVVYNSYGTSVFVVQPGPSPTVREVAVTTGDVRGDQVAVTSGLADGDVVVTAGQVKLRQGSSVTINNSVEPANNPTPNPAEE